MPLVADNSEITMCRIGAFDKINLIFEHFHHPYTQLD